jgi:hypothetical protein
MIANQLASHLSCSTCTISARVIVIAVYTEHSQAYIVVAIIVVCPAKVRAKVVALLADDLQSHIRQFSWMKRECYA